VTRRSSYIGLVLAAALTCSLHSAQVRAEDTPGAASTSERGVANATASSADRERSRAAFRRGVTQLRAQDWSGARASFEEAWSLVQHPSILLNLGIARLRTDEPVLAEQDLVRFLSEDAGAQPEEVSSARDALAEARSRIGTLRVVATPPSSRVSVDGKAIAVRTDDGVAETRVKVGAHAVTVDAEGFAADKRDVDVPAKSETVVKIDLARTASSGDSAQKPEQTSDGARSSRTTTRTIVGWSLAGLGGAALVASGVMALDALGLSHDYADPSSKSFQSQSVKSEGVAFRTGADVALLGALLAGAGAFILLFTDFGARAQPTTLRW
jgi:hypothetical protein